MTRLAPLAAGLAGVGLLCATAGLASSGGGGRNPVLSTSPPVYARAPAVAVPPSGGVATGGTVSVDDDWVARSARSTGIPGTAVRAYGRAVLLLQQDSAECALGWTTLAGIGLVESVHGTIGGRTLAADGHSSSRILGPALDGAGPVAAIPATPASAAWHGNPRWDHAVGPLQFIPSTWVTWASDGDGDGVADPNDLDDAAYAAARYLCADGHDLATGAGWGAAVFSYNHAQVYVDTVHAAATTYAAHAP